MSTADEEVVVFPLLPEPGEVLGSHLVVAVDLEDPFAARLAIAAENCRAMARVRLARDDEAGLPLYEPLEDSPSLVARAVVVREELVVDAEARELLEPRGHDLGDYGGLVVDGHHDRHFRVGEVAGPSSARVSGSDGRPERWQDGYAPLSRHPECNR